MGNYNIVNAGSMVAGQPEDISQVLANFQAIQAVLNGGIDDVNIRSTAAIAPSKFAGYPSSGVKMLMGDGTWQEDPYCQCRSSTVITCPGGGVTTTLTFDVDDSDNLNMHDVATNTNRITVPRAGIYLATLSAIATATGTQPTTNYVRFRANGTSNADSTLEFQTGALECRFTLCQLFKLAANDYLDVAIFNNSANTITLSTSAPSSPTFRVAFVGTG